MKNHAYPHSKPAPLWRRFVALGYDCFILAALSMAYGAAVTGLQYWLAPSSHQGFQPTLKNPLFFCVWMALIVGYFCYSWLKSGQTIGMKAWRIQLVTASHPLNIQRALLRCFTGLLGTVFLGAGFMYKWFNTNNDCWQDVITHTRIITLP